MAQQYHVSREVIEVSRSVTDTRWIIKMAGRGTLAEVYDANLAYKIVDLLNQEETDHLRLTGL